MIVNIFDESSVKIFLYTGFRNILESDSDIIII